MIVTLLLVSHSLGLSFWNSIASAKGYRSGAARTKREPAAYKKWIVVTSSHSVENIKSLTREGEWQVVVIENTNSVEDRKLEGIHFLGVEEQQLLGYKISEAVLNNSQASRNIGYLYAIERGAEWIFDADDDIELTMDCATVAAPPGGGEMFPQAKIFNPYEFLGLKHLWPRGFPRKYMKNHTNDPDRFCLCHELRTPIVQHSLLRKDAIFSRISVEKSPKNDGSALQDGRENSSGELISRFAPPVILDIGFYTPWHSRNTLFHRSAFFILFQPATLPAKVTEIWRSYFIQKLLHMIGERVGFYPVGNSYSREDTHSSTNDWISDREGERTGELVRFLDAWECPHRKIINCTMLLATELSKRNFWKTLDVKAVQLWINDLQNLGCEFPLRNDFSKHILATAYEHGCGANCRRASLELEPEMDHKIDRSDLKLRAFSELARWCAKSGFSDLLQNLPNSSQLSTFHANNDVLADLTETVLVVTSNYPWNKTIGLLQRLYQPYFGVTIFCGPWFPEDYDDRNGSFPRMLRPFNYIHIEVDEMRSGWFAYYCLAKVKELRLRNVKGYFVMADDTTFNFWNAINLDAVLHPIGHTHSNGEGWWDDPAGSEAAKKTVRLFEEVYKEDPKVQVTWKKFTKGFRSQNNTNSTASELLMRADGWTASDFYYIPSAGLDYYSELMEIFFQAGLFHEIAMSKYLYSVPHRTLENSKFLSLLFPKPRSAWYLNYTAELVMIHPIKLSLLGNYTIRNRAKEEVDGKKPDPGNLKVTHLRIVTGLEIQRQIQETCLSFLKSCMRGY
ncbi:hypothetical protein Y032_0106g3764 [Ancylostoma ceylanicum]|uniref:Nucleotide-diphospho-sugar transferase domain-containing protein n=1 Tax=Ancylostoma ceylanicum TaxID=53326 RepID=A0A016TG07_9BILA|nr:hypothetical protein Y032_0106g3764 [Ancylostoma ceylanicum]